MHQVRSTQFTPTPQPRSSPPQSSPLVKSNVQNINLKFTPTLSKSIPLQLSVNQSIDKAMSYLTLP